MWIRSSSFIIAVLLSVLLAGCGGGSNLAPAPGRGSIAIAFHWPAPSREFPAATQSITVTVCAATGQTFTKTADRPVDTASMPPTVMTFLGVPSGTLTITATAYPQTGGQGTPLASGTVTQAIIPGQQTGIALTMGSIPQSIILSDTSISLNISDTLQLHPTIKDAAGEVVLLPAGSLTWTALPAGVVDVSADGLLTGVSVGNATVEVKVNNTTVSTSLLVFVNEKPLSAPTAAALADSVATGNKYGGNMVKWSAGGTNVVAYLLYRDNNLSAPIAILDGKTTSYIDFGGPLQNPDAVMESDAVAITIDPATGAVTNFSTIPAYDVTGIDLTNPAMTLTATSLDITGRRLVLVPGITFGYQVRVLFEQASSLAMSKKRNASGFALALGNLSSSSTPITTIMPPILALPGDGTAAADGQYMCGTPTGPDTFILQVSADPAFPAAKTVTVTATQAMQGTATAIYPVNSIMTEPRFQGAMTLYWRMGARVNSEPPPLAFSDPSQNGYVFSNVYSFPMPVG